MTVLILAPELNITADHMVRMIEQRGVSVVRFDTAWFPQRASIEAELRAGRWVGTLVVGAREVELEGLRSIWYRNPSAFRFPAGLSPTERHWAMSEAKLGLAGVLASLPNVLWVNHPARNADAAYKPVQLATAARCGLNVPDSMITNRAAAVFRFASRAESVTKSLGAPSIVESGARKTAFTRRIDDEDLADLRGLDVTAHQFQQWVPKSYEARVVVVGEQVFAAGIYAGSAAAYVDWRNDYSALEYARIRPPRSVLAGVLEYCVEMGLNYGAFDFVIQPDGQWVFLECNACGQYGWIEDALGSTEAPITKTLADLLITGVTR